MIVLAVAMPVLFALLALLVDLGFAYASRERVRAAADSAALAAVRELAWDGTDAAILSAATTYAGRNGAGLDLVVAPPFYLDEGGNNVGSVGAGSVPAEAVGVEVRAGISMSTFFAGILNRPVLPIWVRSRAMVVNPGVVPFGVPEQPFDSPDQQYVVGHSYQLYLDDQDELGLLDFRNKNSNWQDIADDVAYGYPNPVQVGAIYAQPNGENMNAAVKQGVQTRLSQGRTRVVVPVVQTAPGQKSKGKGDGSGGGTDKQVLGFVAFSLDTSNNRSLSFDGSVVDGVFRGEETANFNIRLVNPSGYP